MPKVEIFSTNKFEHEYFNSIRSISAESDDKRSMKITQIGEYVTCYEICTTVEGDMGGYRIPQYRPKKILNTEIPCRNLRNTDTVQSHTCSQVK